MTDMMALSFSLSLSLPLLSLPHTRSLSHGNDGLDFERVEDDFDGIAEFFHGGEAESRREIRRLVLLLVTLTYFDNSSNRLLINQSSKTV